MKASGKDLDDAELHQLVEHARTKDTKSVARLCEMFYPKVYRYFSYDVDRIEGAEDLTNEIADMLGKNPGAVRAIQFRALRWLFTPYSD